MWLKYDIEAKLEINMRTYLAVAALILAPGLASAAVIGNGTVSLGVNALGQLNADGVGLRYEPNSHEATIHGCPM